MQRISNSFKYTVGNRYTQCSSDRCCADSSPFSFSRAIKYTSVGGCLLIGWEIIHKWNEYGKKNVKRYSDLFKCPIKVIILKIFLNLLVDLVTHMVSSVINRLFCNPHPIQYETCDYYCYVDSLKEDKPVSAATSQTKPSGLGIRNSKISYHYWLVNGSIAVSHWLFLPAPDTHHQDATNM